MLNGPERPPPIACPVLPSNVEPLTFRPWPLDAIPLPPLFLNVHPVTTALMDPPRLTAPAFPPVNWQFVIVIARSGADAAVVANRAPPLEDAWSPVKTQRFRVRA